MEHNFTTVNVNSTAQPQHTKTLAKFTFISYSYLPVVSQSLRVMGLPSTITLAE